MYFITKSNFILDRLSISKVSSSSEDSEYLAANAIDGNPKTFYASNPVLKPDEWIQLQLENLALVSKVIITESSSSLIDRESKKDSYRLRNVCVFVGNIETTNDDRNLMDRNKICESYSGLGMIGEEIILSCKPSAIEGKFVTIQKLDHSVLNVAEIEVIGKELSFNGLKKGFLNAYHFHRNLFESRRIENASFYREFIFTKMITEMCTGSFVGTDPIDERPPAGTKCVSQCFLSSDRVSDHWGASYCYTSEDESQWGAECTLCSGNRLNIKNLLTYQRI